MSKKWTILLFLLFIFNFFPQKAFAIENPLSVPNNKFGIHILFTNELEKAAKLVNSSGGEWGYVTIPIQSGDRDLVKWQKFMDDAKKNKIIPIIRLATEGDYFNTKVWRKPAYADLMDFANFLDSLDWPVKNRYIIIFNEVNRSDEWGGETNPKEYADMLNYAVTIFKSKSQNFFVIPSGMDNAASNVPGESFNEYTFFRKMNESFPGIFNQIDGISSHSYPNPGFSKPPSVQTQMSIASFKYEKELIESLSSNKNFPVFITETGWSREFVPADTIASFYKEAISGIWQNENIVAISPFLLEAHAGPFTNFSFIKDDGTPSMQYKEIEKMPKTQGKPVLYQKVLGEEAPSFRNAEVKNFPGNRDQKKTISKRKTLESIFKWLLKI
ncbi:MAG: hypothetical protein M1450_04230 [Patescibacteria group bacterium]|nr:hypothetical protein [Patescibacteria group bacterium]